jgi:hypothetical protein
MPAATRPLWTCPKCKHRFVTRNLWHSCSPYTVQDFFAGKNPHAKKLYRALLTFIRAHCGSVAVSPNKTRISFQSRVRFAGVTKADSMGITAGFWLVRKLASPRFTRVEFIPPRNYIYSFRIESEADLDDEVRSWLREAYAVGRQEHLAPQPKSKGRP